MLLMLIVLMCTLLLMLLIALYFTNFQLLSPSIVLIFGFIIATFSSLYVFGKTGLTIELITYLIITLSIGTFMFGEASARVTVNSARKLSPSTKRCNQDNGSVAGFIPIELIFLAILIAFLTLLEQYEYTLEAGRLFSSNGSTLELIAKSRICSIDPLACESVPFKISAKIGLLLTKAVAYFAVYLLVFNQDSIKFKKKIYKHSLRILLFLFCLQLLISTARSGFIYFFIYIFALWGFYQYQNSLGNKYATKTILIRGIFAFFFASICFYLLGYFTSKSNSIGLIDMMVGYTGSQIFALDLYLNGECNSACSQRGYEMFYGIRSALHRLGLADTFMAPNLPFADIGNGTSTNIYTAIRRVVSDFGLLGSFLYFYISGFFYGFLFKNIRTRLGDDFYIILYCMLLFPLFMMAWEEKLSNIVFSSFMILHIFITYLFFVFFERRKQA